MVFWSRRLLLNGRRLVVHATCVDPRKRGLITGQCPIAGDVKTLLDGQLSWQWTEEVEMCNHQSESSAWFLSRLTVLRSRCRNSWDLLYIRFPADTNHIHLVSRLSFCQRAEYKPYPVARVVQRAMPIRIVWTLCKQSIADPA